MHSQHFGFIGLGLIGGSIARALKTYIPNCKITVYDIIAENIDMARSEGIADICADSVNKCFSDCDIIFFCAPVAINNENLEKIKPFLSSDTLLTDAGSVKGEIHSKIEELGLERQFIGGHPMAGSERTGYANSKVGLLKNAYYILTPTKAVPTEKCTYLENLIKQIGAIPLTLTYNEHDYVTAGISHLPHVISASLVNLVKKNDNKEGIMKMIAAGGFKDITRISSSSPIMWEHICMTNSKPILRLLEQYQIELEEIKKEIENKDSENIRSFFQSARDYRESFIEVSSGPIKCSYVFYVEIPDEPGALATIATLLAFQRINIKNIGITHNRETEAGSLRIELYEEKDIPRASEILSAKGYTVFIKK